MTELITQLGQVITGLMGQISTVAETVVNTPILFIPFGISFFGAAVYGFKRLTRARG